MSAISKSCGAAAALIAGVCVPLLPVAGPSANFLCYATGDAVYVAPDYKSTLDLLKDGYFDPNAVPGNVKGGTNLGAYHLSCDNKPGTQYVNDSGEVSNENLAGLPGWYPVEKVAG